MAYAINDAGQAVGFSSNAMGNTNATEWSGGSAILLPNLQGATYSAAYGINDAGQIVGISRIGSISFYATEWSGGSVINLGGLPNTYPNVANSINAAGQSVGALTAEGALNIYATEWSGGSVINLGPGVPYAVNNAGQVVGYDISGGPQYAVEWSDGSVINLDGLPGSYASEARDINDAGQIVGFSFFAPPAPVPESSTWALMLIGFAGLGYAGYRSQRVLGQNSRL